MTSEMEPPATGRPETGPFDPTGAWSGIEALDSGALAITGELQRGAVVGRHVVLRRIGRGGMGVVYAAYDPELDRKLAIKLLLVEDGDPRGGRLQREAQALAQLAHPNVVAVHDVGTLGDRVWIAMEFVDGLTLSAWLTERPRDWSAVLAVFLAAGEGLRAAHQAGLVHRDFKPDNVMIGVDGRARVMDFGLARADAPRDPGATLADLRRASALDAALTRVGSVLGTPRYMAPEQWHGAATDARTDQFAFCVALWEALYGQPPMAGANLAQLMHTVTGGRITPPPASARVPGWLRRVIQRGLAVDPARRWPSMAALLGALRSDPRPRRRALASIGGVLLATLAGLAWTRVSAARRASTCEGAAQALASTWTDETRAELRAAMTASGAESAVASAERALPWLDLNARRWSETAGENCRAATIDRSVPLTTAARVAGCLGERRAEFTEMIALLRAATPKELREAVDAAARLTDPRGCVDPSRRSDLDADAATERHEVVALRQQLARARAQSSIGRQEAATARFAAIEARSAALGLRELPARAALNAGISSERGGDYVGAREHLEAAFYRAGAAGLDEIAAEAADWLTFVVGHRLTRVDPALAWARLADMYLEHMQAPADDLRRAHLHSSRGAVLLQRDPAAAGREFEQALAIYTRLHGPEHPDVANALGNVGAVQYTLGAHDEALASVQQALAVETAVYGRHHPSVAGTLGNLAAMRLVAGDCEQASAGFQEALAVYEANHGGEHPLLAGMLNNLGAARLTCGDVDAALDDFRRALAIRERALGPDHPEVAGSLDGLRDIHAMRGDHDAALAAGRRALEIHERNHGPVHADVAHSLDALAAVQIDRGELGEAAALYRRSLAIRVALAGPDAPASAASHVGLGEVELARGAYTAARAPLERALALAEAADDAPSIARALVGLARVDIGLGDAAAAIAPLERALSYPPEPGDPLARLDATFALATALWTAQVDRPRALELAAQTRDALASAGASARGRLAAVEAWLTDPSRR